jgi:putative transposase
MSNNTYQSSARSRCDMKAHLVLVTKYRRKVISVTIMQRLTELVQHLCNRWGCQMIEFNGEADHVHLLFGYYPQLDLSKFVNNLKTVTSRMIRKEFATWVSRFYWKPVFWNSAYFVASCGGVTVETLKRYVQQQGHT